MSESCRVPGPVAAALGCSTCRNDSAPQELQPREDAREEDVPAQAPS